MSPPKVSLAGKEPLKSIDLNDETPEKGDGVDFPSVITVETERRVRMARCQRKRVRCQRIMCGVILLIIILVAALGTVCLVKYLRRYHRQAWKCGVKDSQMPENVKVDAENQLIRTQHDQADKMPAMESLHEYNRGLVAFKDLDNNVCYIDRLDETFQEGYERWESYEIDDRDPKALKVISKPIEVEVLKHIGDIHIYAHCENAKSMWVMEIEMTEVTEEMEVVYV